jgi:hypothetical protein
MKTKLQGPNGYWLLFSCKWSSSVVGRRIHGKQDGICVSYYSNGMIADSAMFQKGVVVDKDFAGIVMAICLIQLAG